MQNKELVWYLKLKIILFKLEKKYWLALPWWQPSLPYNGGGRKSNDIGWSPFWRDGRPRRSHCRSFAGQHGIPGKATEEKSVVFSRKSVRHVETGATLEGTWYFWRSPRGYPSLLFSCVFLVMQCFLVTLVSLSKNDVVNKECANPWGLTGGKQSKSVERAIFYSSQNIHIRV